MFVHTGEEQAMFTENLGLYHMCVQIFCFLEGGGDDVKGCNLALAAKMLVIR